MKVTDIKKVNADTKTKPTITSKNSGSDKNQMFQRQITSLNDIQQQKHFEDLQLAIAGQGEVIKKRADIKEIQKYRQMITELLNEVVSSSYICSKSDIFDARGKHKVFVMIKNINKKLDEMTKEMLAEQTDNLRLVEMVDDIRGLLVDLLL